MQLPVQPMAPISSEQIPAGDDWGYQLKWDGVRILSKIDQGRIELYSRKLLRKDAIFPEVVQCLHTVKASCLLDGEVIMLDPVKGRPSFQRVLQRERSKRAVRSETLQAIPITYVLFDILYLDGHDLRESPYIERHKLLSELFPDKKPNVFVSDLFPNGEALWNWVVEHEWEGIISKRLSSTYRQGKKHHDWYKKKTSLQLEVVILGLVIRDGSVASMVMVDHNANYLGRVSLGLDMRMKALLQAYGSAYPSERLPFTQLPADLKGERVQWLSKPFACEVTGLEITEAGLLRHSKIVHLSKENLQV